jgi:hypothetical protein
MSARDWQMIGEKARWLRQGQMADHGLSDPDAVPLIDVSKYGDRTWAVYVNGELLCVTVYLKGAMAVKGLIERLWQRVRD